MAKTGNEAAVTRNLQRISLANNLVLLDSPGLLWPNIENINSGYRIATTGGIKDTALSHEDIAYFLAEYLLSAYQDKTITYFKLDAQPDDASGFLQELGRRRGALRSGGQIDQDKTAKILLTEYRSGRLGRFTLETPEMIAVEMCELETIRQQKAEQKKLRKQKTA